MPNKAGAVRTRCHRAGFKPPLNRKRIVLDVRHRRLRGKGFGCYFAGSVQRGMARIIVDCDAIAWTAAEHRSVRFKRLVIETIAHEFVHALEDLYGLMFNERAVERAIHRTRRKADP